MSMNACPIVLMLGSCALEPSTGVNRDARGIAN
jgi:hypothetical protein